jgi:Tfp pilus assembly protein PilW
MTYRLFPTGSRRSRRVEGFTLVEAMVALALSSMIMVAVLTTFIMSVRGFRAIANYAEIHADGRLAIDQFARDMRAVNDITSCGASNLVVSIPTAFSNSGTALTNKTVTYSISNGTLYRTDSATGITKGMANNIYSLEFKLYNKVGSQTTVLDTAKGIQIDLKLRKYVQSQLQSEDFLSARLDMRNIQ